MTKRAKRVLYVCLAVLVIFVLMVLLAPKPKGPTRQQLQNHLDQSFHREVQRLYRHEILALYDPPAEAFTPAGYRLLQDIQGSYSKVFLPYLVSGATIVQPDVLWNPYFDMFILVEDSNGLINSVVLASSLTGGETPQRDLQGDYWQEMYRRYQIAQLATFTHPTPYADFSYVILQMRNLSHHYNWPARLPLTTARVPFDLYMQQPNQAIYCTPIEPGAYVIFNVVRNKLRTNVMDLPPFVVYQTQRKLQNEIDDSNETGRQLLQDKANLPKKERK